MSNKVRTATARVAAASRTMRQGKAVTVKDGLLVEARNDLLAARVEVAIDKALDPEPPYEPLRDADRKRLAKRLDP